jgi:hypothetical protein
MSTSNLLNTATVNFQDLIGNGKSYEVPRRLENDASGRDCDFESDPGTIEHILPENPSDEWEGSVPRNRWEDAAFRLGNLTLLKASTNRSFGTARYTEKLAGYAESEYTLTQKLATSAPEDWTLALLDARQAAMAARAAHIWRSDFADAVL